MSCGNRLSGQLGGSRVPVLEHISFNRDQLIHIALGLLRCGRINGIRHFSAPLQMRLRMPHQQRPRRKPSRSPVQRIVPGRVPRGLLGRLQFRASVAGKR